MFKFKKKSKYDLKIGTEIYVQSRNSILYATFKVSKIEYDSVLKSSRLYGVCIESNNTGFNLGNQYHICGMEYLSEHIESKLMKINKDELKNI